VNFILTVVEKMKAKEVAICKSERRYVFARVGCEIDGWIEEDFGERRAYL